MKRVAKTVGALGLVGCTAVMNSQLAVAADSGWYGGLGVGQTQAKIDDAGITAGLLGSGFSNTTINDNDSDLGYKLFGGLKVNKNFAIEGGYFNLGNFGFTATTTPAGTFTGDIKLNGFNIDAVGILPLSEKFSGFGRIGLQYAKAEDSFSGTGAVVVANPNPNKSATNYKYGLGAQYDFTETVGMRAEWERYRINDAVSNRGDIDMLSLGVVVSFGGSSPAHTHTPMAKSEPMRAPPAAKVVAAAAAPPPSVLVVVPVAPRTEEYCSILDIQFEINETDIQREEKEKLAVLGTFLTKYPDTTAVIEGHSDNVGVAEENMKLSQRRAESVVSYLVDTLHIAPARLSAVGYGDTRPLADNNTEEGKRQNRRIGAVIACATDIEGLQPIPARITMAMLIEFDENKADIRPQYRDEIGKVATFMKANPNVTATVEGHTGNLQGTSAQALEISQKRAQNVVDYLVNNFGIDRSRLSAEGFGQTRRFAYNTSLEGQQENRRVNIIINYPKR